MTEHYERLQDGFATIYLTLASVVIALALEKLFDRMVTVAPFPPVDPAGVLTWVQGGIVLVVAFTMFIMVSYLVLALRWDIGVVDAGMPFLLLILLAAVITTIGRGAGTAFFFIAAVGQGSGGLAFLQILREAGRNSVNDEILARSDYAAAFTMGTVSWVVPLSAAILLQIGIIGARGAVAGAVLLLASLVGLLWTFSRSWWRAMDPEAATS